jgi:ATP-binding cassette subfamily B protein
VLYGNDDIRTLDLKTYRSNIAHVDQEPQLFLNTIEENIKFGNLNATPEDILQACQTAIAYDFIQRLDEVMQIPRERFRILICKRFCV